MGRNNFFQFKEFRVIQEKAAMKVGIDSVLLGAWACFDGAGRILDIGTGTGLLALMAAQRSQATVDAVELEPEAALDACANFNNSGWQSRLNLYICAIQSYEPDVCYDHIISNPPFFENSSKSVDAKRTTARHSDTLTLSELLKKAVSMLNENGKISLILPVDKEERLRYLAREEGVYLSRFSRVSPDARKSPHRILVELSRQEVPLHEFPIAIRQAGSSQYSEQYRQLTKEFYLAF